MPFNQDRMNSRLEDAASMLRNAQRQLEEAQAKYAEIEKLVKTGSLSYDYVLHFPAKCWKKSNLDIIYAANSIEAAKSKLVGYTQVNENELSRFLLDDNLDGNVEVNDVFAIPYFDYKDDTIEKLLPFVVFKLVGGLAFCHCLFSIRPEVFAKNESNDYETSDIRKVLTKLVACFDSKIASHFHTHSVDWVHPVTDEEKIFEDKFWLLDFAELYTHFKTAESRKRSYLFGSYSGKTGHWWLRNPVTDNATHEYHVYMSGASYTTSTSYGSIGLAPACVLGY